MSTIKDVAAVAKVSVATVSRVVNQDSKVRPQTREKVLAVMEQLGYRPNAAARALVTQKSNTIGVVIPELTDPFFSLLANGVDHVCRQTNTQLLLSTGALTQDSEREAIQLLMERRCDAMVVHSKLLDDQELISYAEQVPGLVLIDRFIPQLAQRCTWLDNQAGGKLAAAHLLNQGRRRFACITSNYQIDDPKLRLQGFSEYLSHVGESLSEELIVAADPNQAGGESAAKQLLSKQLPFDGLFVYNDAMAIGAISSLLDHGIKVPQQVAVVGFDDVLLARYCRPKLTTLRYPIELMAKQAARLAISITEKKTIEIQDNQHKPELVLRESTQV